MYFTDDTPPLGKCSKLICNPKANTPLNNMTSLIIIIVQVFYNRGRARIAYTQDRK